MILTHNGWHEVFCQLASLGRKQEGHAIYEEAARHHWVACD
jgi:hypothetical protein